MGDNKDYTDTDTHMKQQKDDDGRTNVVNEFLSRVDPVRDRRDEFDADAHRREPVSFSQ